MRSLTDLSYNEHCKLDIFLPDGAENPPVYIFFHGGGLENGNKDFPETFCDRFVSRGIAVASADYRMYPTAKFPDFVTDAAEAVAYIINQSGINFGKVTVGGSSAGAYLSMMLYFNEEYLKNAGVDPRRISGYIFNGGQPTSHYNYLKYDKQSDSRRVLIDEAAPLYYLQQPYADAKLEPEILILCADNDMPNRLNQTRMMITTMHRFGFPNDKLTFKIYENETHGSYTGKEFYRNDVINFLEKVNRT